MRLQLFFIFLVLVSQFATAHPVSSQGTLNFIGESQENSQALTLIYSIDYDFGIGLRTDIEDEGDKKIWTPQFSYLVKRINAPFWQANLYIYGGVGFYQLRNSDETNYYYGTQIDWESRKFYTMFKHEKMQTKDFDIKDYYEYRVGFAPYIARFDEINAWLILQATQDTAIEEAYDVTPIIRLFYQNVLLELGQSFRGNSVFNFMVHYYF